MEYTVSSRGPVLQGPLGETAMVEMPARSGTCASQRHVRIGSEPSTDRLVSGPFPGDPDDSDISRDVWLEERTAPCAPVGLPGIYQVI